MKKRSVRIPAAMALCAPIAFPAVADAHLVTTGLGPVYDGIGHLLLTPQDFIAVLALCLLAGLRGTAHSRKVLFLLPLAWFAAGFILRSFVTEVAPFPIAAVSFVALGAMVAADVKLSSLSISVLAILLGLAHGWDNGVAMEAGAGWKGLLGIMIGLFVVVAISTALIVSLQRPWERIAIRVLGSWIVATGIMMLGWHFRPEPSVDEAQAVPLGSAGLFMSRKALACGQEARRAVLFESAAGR